MKLKRILSLLLVLATFLLTLTSCGLDAYLTDILNHPQVEFKDLNYSYTSLENFEKLEKELDDMISSLAKPYDVLYKLDEMFEHLNTIYSSEAILSIRNSLNLANKEIEQKYLECSELSVTFYDRCSTAANKVTKYCPSEAKAYWGEDVYLIYSEYTPYGDQYLNKYAEEQQLINEYNTATMKEYSTTFKGNKITFENMYQYELSDEEYETVMTDLYRQFNEEVTPIYLKLITVRRELSKLLGTESVAENYYLNYFYREYSIENVEKTYSDVKKYLVPLYNKLLKNSEKQDLDGFYYDSLNCATGTLLQKVGEKLIKKFPEMKYAFNHMTKFGYYDVEYSSTKMNVSFTTLIPSVNTPFLFINPTNTAEDMSTIVHEFGHYYAMYTNPYYAYDMDVSEIHSQALELLAMDIYNEITNGEYEDVIINEKMLLFLNSIIIGCLYNEFEAYVYNNNVQDTETLNKKMMSLMREYGLIDDSDTRDELYSWVETVHLFMYPFYYISYSVSAVSALDIYYTYLEDEKAGKELYLEIVNSPDTYITACQNTGVKSFFDDGVIKSLAEKIENITLK